MSQYASATDVSVERSEGEIKRTLIRYGADDIVSGQSVRTGQAFVQFVYSGLPLEARIPLPPLSEFGETPTGRTRREPAALREWEKAVRQQWRVLLLLIKAKLEAVENGIAPAEQEFLSWIILPGGETVGQRTLPQVRAAVEKGHLPKLIAGPVRGGE